MRLYNYDLSPFASRCRFVVYAKNLPIEIVGPPHGGPRSEAYRAINPIGTVPALMLDDQRTLPESAVIVEYLEERFPEPALLPAAPEDRATTRLLARLADLYLIPPMGRLFGQTRPELRDATTVNTALAEIKAALAQVEYFMTAGGWAVGRDKSLADAALVPVLFLLGRLLPRFGHEQPFAGLHRLDIYCRSIGTDPIVQRVRREMENALESALVG